MRRITTSRKVGGGASSAGSALGCVGSALAKVIKLSPLECWSRASRIEPSTLVIRAVRLLSGTAPLRTDDRNADAAARIDFFRTKGGGSLKESGKGHALPAAYGDLR